MSEIEVSSVLPVYNDREALTIAIPRSIEHLEAIAPGRFELIVAEDGSSDGSAEFVRECAESDPRVRLMHGDERLGRGKALARAFAGAHGPIVCYYDVDLATDMQHLAELIAAIRDGADIATGSRLLPESNIVRTGDREIASRGYNRLVRTILKSHLYDHQCGFKAFNRARLLTLLPSVESNHWFWDTEVLVRAQRNGYRISEFPVRWRQGEGTTVKPKDVLEMGSAILHLWWQLHAEKN
ncbi:glycosyltransferase family 2 protein [Methanoculleus sp. FWC-SCC1]|uniref:Glycosyltransferase family 2 protein n=1 Tax=Methanoculleus frigidifontis TaxID=2584085 RepID=A0ABT8MBY2_9EURY|nr:dolichyl-phosphate beta-glucosyltransferase [Methanoculleus sp. FWC-SCC1]MDN7025385.1 glycosyltransferase family 2 protein [Methanoculleus sp. FWC-SCC1]